MRIVARYADEWNVWGDVERLKQKMEVLDRHCEAVERDPHTIQRSAAVQIYLSDDVDLVARLRANPPGNASIAGNVEELREIVVAYADAGVDELIMPDSHLGPGTEKLEALDRFIEEVAPVARSS